MGLNANRIKKSYEGSCKPVLQYSINGNLIGAYESARKATLETGVSYRSISLCCRGKTHSLWFCLEICKIMIDILVSDDFKNIKSYGEIIYEKR